MQRGCIGVGLQYSLGEGVTKSDAEANPRFEAACQAGNGAGCNMLGYQHQEGRGFKRDERRAFEFFSKACDLGKLQGCANAGRQLRYGMGRPKDPKKGVALFQRACDGNDGEGCFQLSYEYLAGGTQPRDDLKALALNQRACDLGTPGGCRNVGLAYSKGTSGLPVDKDKARVLFRSACADGYKLGCDDARGLDRPVARRGTRARGGGGGDLNCPGPGITRRCNGVCTSIQTSSNCGACGAACRPGYHCDGLFCRDASGSL